MKSFKRFIASLLTVVLLLSSAPVSGLIGLELPNIFDVFASAEIYSGTCGDNLNWVFDEATGELAINGTGAMGDFEVGKLDINLIKTLKLSEGVTSISSGTFKNCKNLENITIPNSVTSIGEGAFNNTKFYDNNDNWKDNVLYIGNFLICAKTGLVACSVKSGTKVIADSAFAGCKYLTQIVLPDSVSHIGLRAFASCTSLDNITMSDNLEQIGQSAFYNTLVYNNLNNWENEVLYIDNYLIEADANLSGKYEIRTDTKCIADYAFYGCKKITEVLIPENINSIPLCAFRDCSKLKSVSLGNNVATIFGGAFFNCTGLESFYIPNGVKVIGGSAFCGCSNLININIPKSIARINYDVFKNCTSLSNVYFEGDISDWCNIKFYGFTSNPLSVAENLYINGKLLENELVIPENINSINDYAFYNYQKVKDILISDNVLSIGREAFYDCVGVENISLGKNVASIGYMAFTNCGSKELKIPRSVTSIGFRALDGRFESFVVDEDNPSYSSDSYGVLYDKSKKVLIKYPKIIKRVEFTVPDSVVKIGPYSFKGANIEKVIIGDSVKEISEAAFYAGFGIESVIIGNGVSVIGEKAFYYCCNMTDLELGSNVTTIGRNAFQDCHLLRNFTLGNKVEIIGARAFDYCYSLTEMIIPDSVKTIGESAFIDCFRLSRVKLGDNVTFIGNNAFVRSSIVTIAIPESATNIQNYAFWNCEKLTDIYYMGTEETWTSMSVTVKNSVSVHFNHRHSYIPKITTEATCNYNGVKTYICDCGDRYQEVIDALGHSMGDWEIETKPTCTTDGYEVKRCTRCWYNYSRKITRLGHSYTYISMPSVNNEPSYFSCVCYCGFSCDFKVALSDVKLNYKNSIYLNPDINIDDSLKYTVSYVSSNPSVATVDENGNIYGAGKGNATITCTVTDEFGNVVSDTCDVEVNYTFGQWLIVIFLFGWIWY